MSVKFSICRAILAFLIAFTSYVSGQSDGKLSLHYSTSMGLSIVIQHDLHREYGFAYPETYSLKLPSGSNGLSASKRYYASSAWISLPTKGDSNSFNFIDAVRFDYANDEAYVTAAFSANSESLFIRIVDGSGNPVSPGFQGVCKYYDNRQEVVTVSAEDWSDWVVQPGWFTAFLSAFRSRGLYVTVGAITGNPSASTWRVLQSHDCYRISASSFHQRYAGSL